MILHYFNYSIFTAGFGYELDGLQIDLSFEYLKGKDRDIPYEKVLLDPEWETAMPGLYKMTVIIPTVSISYKL